MGLQGEYRRNPGVKVVEDIPAINTNQISFILQTWNKLILFKQEFNFKYLHLPQHYDDMMMYQNQY